MRLSLIYNARVAEMSKPSEPKAHPSATPSGAAGTVDVQSLLAGKTEVRLVHRGEEYRLRITRQGKLILTK